jgi:predicted DNA-binding transcriptional regulator AlpA
VPLHRRLSRRPDASPEKLIRVKEVTMILGLSEAEIRRRVAVGSFPRAVRVGKYRIARRLSDVLKWLRDLPVHIAGRPPEVRRTPR